MDFYVILDQVIDLLRQRQRVTYRALKRQFDLDDTLLEDVRVELIKGQRLAHEDHAVRACYAALAMQETIRRYSAEVRRSYGLDVQIRAGLNAGEVVVRSIGNDLHMDYSAIGQTTHLAARMEQLARPGTTLLTAETLRLVEGLVQVTALGPVPIRGLAEPVEVFELVGASALRGRFQARMDSDDPRAIRAKVTGQILTLDETLQETIPALLGLLDALPQDSPS